MISVLSESIWFMRASLRNRARQLKARIKSPRYAIAMIFGLGYFFLMFGMPMLTHASAREQATGGTLMVLSRSIGGLGIALLAASWWLWRTDREGITLTPAEANLLVPAPITRRQLIQFKLLRSQPGLLTSALITSLLTHASTLPLPVRLLSAWALFSTLQLHRYGASLVHTSLAENGKSGWRRVWIAAVIFAVMLGAVIWSIGSIAIAAAGNFDINMITTALAAPPAAYALAPFRAIMAPMNARDVLTWAPAFASALVILVLHYLWVIRSDAAFEENAATAGVKRAAMVEAVRAGQGSRFRAAQKPNATVRPAWFPLRPIGKPATAVLWKNVIGVTRGVSTRLLSVVASVVLMAVIFMYSQRANGKPHHALRAVAILALGYAVMVTLIAPTRTRYDFRAELKRMDLLRTLPIGGFSLALAEITTSAVVVSLMQFLLLGISLGAYLLSGKTVGPFALLGIPVLIAMFALNATLVALHNWIALVYPAWTTKPGGVEMFGVAMLSMIAGMIMLLLSLVLPSIVGLSAAASVGLQWGQRAYIPGACGVVVGLYAQLMLIVAGVGRAYDRMDPVESTTLT